MSDLLILFVSGILRMNPQIGTNIRVFSALLQDKSAVRTATVTRSFCRERSAALPARAWAEIPHGG
jgi:hypothetical protein